MKFKVLGGKHSQDGRTYRAGDVVETDRDLVAVFGSTTFELLPEPPAPPAPPAPSDPRGIDATEEFPLAVEERFAVYLRGNWYHVYEGDDETPLNEKGLKKPSVEKFIRKCLE